MLRALLAMTLLLGAAVASADDRLEALVASVNRAGTTSRAEAALVEKIAGLASVTPDVLRAEQARSGLGWGDLFIAHRIASRGGHLVERVIAARDAEPRWAIIADEAKVDGALLVQDLTAAFPDIAGVPASPRADGAREPSSASSLKDRVLDLFRGKPDAGSARDDRDPAQEEIRERIMRGGSRGR